ncbi:hypothetical protein C8Q76DRAFT_608671, partial [Earliella scabrosa]
MVTYSYVVQEGLRALFSASTSWDKANAWTKAATIVQAANDKTVGRWNSELDEFLLYSSIFSAVLTAFIVEVFPLLGPSSDSNEPTRPPASSGIPISLIAQNILWFMALALSMTATTLGIIIKQWLHDYRSGMLHLRTQAKMSARHSWNRMDNMKRLRVEAVLAFLFILLEASLVLFFAGILVLLWSLHRVVAITVSATIVAMLVLLVVTIVCPV